MACVGFSISSTFVPPLALHSRVFDVFDPTAAAYQAVSFASSFALAIIPATGVYALVEVPGRKWILVVADRLLDVNRSLRNQNALAE